MRYIVILKFRTNGKVAGLNPSSANCGMLIKLWLHRKSQFRCRYVSVRGQCGLTRICHLDQCLFLQSVRL